MRALFLMLASLAFFVGASRAQAFTNIDIDLSSQRMNVVSSQGAYSWPISSARSGYFTPTGSFSPQAMYVQAYSRKYNNAPMPHAIFFHGGWAIHGSYATSSLGRPASHGCVRLAPGNAATLYNLVKAEGARIYIHGAPPASTRTITASKATKHGARHYARAKLPVNARAYYGYAAPGHAPPQPPADPYAGMF